MILIGVTVMYGEIITARERQAIRKDVQQNGAQAMAIILRSIRNAETVTTPGESDNDDRLRLAEESVDGDRSEFYIEDEVLIEEEDNDPFELTSDRVAVSDLLVENLSRSDTPGNVRVTFTVRSNNVNAQEQYQFERVFRATASVREP